MQWIDITNTTSTNIFCFKIAYILCLNNVEFLWDLSLNEEKLDLPRKNLIKKNKKRIVSFTFECCLWRYWSQNVYKYKVDSMKICENKFCRKPSSIITWIFQGLSHMVNLHICHRINPFIFYNVMQNMFKLHQAKTQKDQTCIAFSRQRRFVILPYNDYAVLIVYAKHEFDLKHRKKFKLFLCLIWINRLKDFFVVPFKDNFNVLP